MAETTPLFVRLPHEVAEKLDHAAFATGRPKRELIARLISDELDAGKVPVPHVGSRDVVVGRHAFRPAPEPPVLTLAQAAALLLVDEEAVAELAEAGELPGRRVGGEWRFARDAVLAWLGSAAA